MPIQKKDTFFKKEYVISFCLPVLFLLAAFAMAGIYPFGGLSMAAGDMREQYIDLLYAFFKKLGHGENFFVLNESRMGVNLYTNEISLLADPLKWILFAVGAEDIPAALELIYLIKTGTAGLCACVFLDRSRTVNIDIRLCAAFGVLYALNMFSIISSINFFWADNVLLLPLCFWGIEKMILDGDMRLFAAVYTICVAIGFYMAYITGMMCLVYFIYVFVLTGGKKFASPFFMLIVSVFIAAALSAFILLPSAKLLLDNFTDKVAEDAVGSFVRFYPTQICRGLLFVENGSPLINTTLDIFAGIMPLYMTVLLLFSGADKKERILTFCVCLFFVISLLIRKLYVFLHFFGEPAAFECRYAFAMSLFLIIFSARAVMHADKIKKWARAAAAAAVLCAAVLGFKDCAGAYYYKFALWAAVLCVLYALFAARTKKAALAVFVCAVLADAAVIPAAGINVIKTFIGYEQNGAAADYIGRIAALTSGADTDGCRMCDLYAAGRMINLRAGYSAADAFISAVNKRTDRFAVSMGLHSVSDGKYLSCADNSVVSDSIFGIRYIMASDKSRLAEDISGRKIYMPDGARLNSPLYTMVRENEKSVMYENKTAFPLMFAADEGVIYCDRDFYDADIISGACLNEQTFINAVLSEDASYFDIYYDIGDALCINGSTDVADGAYYRLTADENAEKSAAVYKFTAEKDGEYIVNFFMDNKSLGESYNSYILTVNGAALSDDHLKNNLVKDIGYFKAGDEIEIGIISQRPELVFAEPCVLRLDTKAFERAAEAVQERGLKDIRLEKGNYTAGSDFDENRFVFTSIGYDEGYTVYIDGKKTQSIAAADAMLGFYVPAGEHDIKIDYVSPLAKEGAYISLFSAAALAGFLAVRHKKRRI